MCARDRDRFLGENCPARAEKLNREVRRQTLTITAALDIAEATYASGTSSNVWQGYFRTLEKLEDFARHRRDPIGDYLDKFDK